MSRTSLVHEDHDITIAGVDENEVLVGEGMGALAI